MFCFVLFRRVKFADILCLKISVFLWFKNNNRYCCRGIVWNFRLTLTYP